MAKRTSKPNTKAAMAAKEPTEDQKPSGNVAQTGAGDMPAPASRTDAPPVTENPAKTGADQPSAPVDKEPDAGDTTQAKPTKDGQADPTEVAKAVVSSVGTDAPRQLTPEENAVLSGQIKGTDAPSQGASEPAIEELSVKNFYIRHRDAVNEKPEDPMDAKGPSHLQVTVVGPAKGFRRAGMAFGKEPTVIPAEELTVRQMMALEIEPELVVTISEKPGAQRAK